MLRLFRQLTADLIAARPHLAHHDVEELAELYLVQFEGAIAIAVAYRATWPVEAVRRHLATWLELS
jgi:hypothetical protein